MKPAIKTNNVDSFNYLEQPLPQRLTSSNFNTENETLLNSALEISKDQNKRVVNFQINTNLKLIHILTITLMQNILFLIFDFLEIDSETLYFGNIFLPLIAYDIYYYIFQFKDISQPTFLNLLIGNYLNANCTKYLKFSTCIFQIMQDMMIYFFTFIVLFNLQVVFKKIANLL